MAVVRWTFEDLYTSDVWTFPFNATEGGTPKEERKIDYSTSSAGNPIIFEGPRQPKTAQFSGTTIEESHHEAFVDWFEKPYPIRFRDDLGRVFDILITSYEPTRVRAPRNPWRHRYVVNYIVLADYGVVDS